MNHHVKNKELASSEREATKYWCETCEGTGSVYQEHQAGCHVGGDYPCPDCDGKGYWSPRASQPSGAAGEQETPETIQAKVDRINLSVIRRFTAMWHEDAVRLGYDGVASMLEAQLLAQSERQSSTFLKRADAQWEENGRLLGRAISVFGDVLGDIGDWEDKALSEAVTEARNGLLRVAMADKPSNICTDAGLASLASPSSGGWISVDEQLPPAFLPRLGLRPPGLHQHE